MRVKTARYSALISIRVHIMLLGPLSFIASSISLSNLHTDTSSRFQTERVCAGSMRIIYLFVRRMRAYLRPSNPKEGYSRLHNR